MRIVDNAALRCLVVNVSPVWLSGRKGSYSFWFAFKRKNRAVKRAELNWVVRLQANDALRSFTSRQTAPIRLSVYGQVMRHGWLRDTVTQIILPPTSPGQSCSGLHTAFQITLSMWTSSTDSLAARPIRTLLMPMHHVSKHTRLPHWCVMTLQES